MAITACMAYADLNPIRAGMLLTPETSDCTSVQERIVERQSAMNSVQGFPCPFRAFLITMPISLAVDSGWNPSPLQDESQSCYSTQTTTAPAAAKLSARQSIYRRVCGAARNTRLPIRLPLWCASLCFTHPAWAHLDRPPRKKPGCSRPGFLLGEVLTSETAIAAVYAFRLGSVRCVA
jgi:hypothetical protein